MTNTARAKDLLWYAREVLREMREASERGVWNGVVRRGQEALELSLKALLLHLGGDYPREHDVAPAFVRLVGGRGLAVDPDRLERLARASADLARKRAPALYAEIACTAEHARAAVAAAEDAFLLATEHLGEPPPGPFRPGTTTTPESGDQK